MPVKKKMTFSFIFISVCLVLIAVVPEMKTGDSDVVLFGIGAILGIPIYLFFLFIIRSCGFESSVSFDMWADGDKIEDQYFRAKELTRDIKETENASRELVDKS